MEISLAERGDGFDMSKLTKITSVERSSDRYKEREIREKLRKSKLFRISYFADEIGIDPKKLENLIEEWITLG